MMEQIEFIIHSDGRVEERVTGVKGADCLALTQHLEEKLGVVTRSEPTQEHYQQATLTQSVQGWS
jgi:hypothetical protein